MTHRGPFQPLLFCDSLIRRELVLSPSYLALAIAVSAAPGSQQKARRRS